MQEGISRAIGGDHTGRIKVVLNITGQLLEFYPSQQKTRVILLNKPATLLEMVSKLGINDKVILFITVDEQIVDKKYLIDRDCTVTLFSPPCGG